MDCTVRTSRVEKIDVAYQVIAKFIFLFFIPLLVGGEIETHNEENCPSCTYFLAESLLAKGDKASALSQYLKRIKLDGSPHQQYKSHLQAAHLMKDLKYPTAQIIEIYENAKKLSSGLLEPLYYLSVLHQEIGNYSRSYEILNSLEKREGPEWIKEWGYLYQLGLACFRLEKYQECAKHFTALLEEKKLPEGYKEEVFRLKELSSQEIKKLHENKKVLLAILARNKGHVLPLFLKCIDNLEYDKKLITIYINTNNNTDNTIELLEKWIDQNKFKYADVIYEHHEIEMDNSPPHAWTEGRIKQLAKIRGKSLQKTKEYGCDFYFVVDVDNFVTPCTLRDLIAKDKPIIAPMLRAIPEPSDFYSNFFYDITENGYFKAHPNFSKILNREMVGMFKVPLVHCTYLVRIDVIDDLTYEDGTNHPESIIFSRSARKHHIDQYICNEKEFGIFLNFFGDPNKLTLEEERRAFDNFLEMHRDLKSVGALF